MNHWWLELQFGIFCCCYLISLTFLSRKFSENDQLYIQVLFLFIEHECSTDPLKLQNCQRFSMFLWDICFGEVSSYLIFLESNTSSQPVGEGGDSASGLSFTSLFPWLFVATLILLVKTVSTNFTHTSVQGRIQKQFYNVDWSYNYLANFLQVLGVN